MTSKAIKRLYGNARTAGETGSLKQWARRILSRGGSPLATAIAQWLDRKAGRC